MRSWLKSSGINPKTLTTEQANTWTASLEEAEEVGAPEADDGWKSAAERTRTMKSLMERLANLPAFESEQVNAEMVRIGITGEVKPTKAQAKELLAAIAEAEELAKATR
jgi:transcription elongation GreA/GreB family factor